MKNRNAYMAVVAAMMFCGLGLTACDPDVGKFSSELTEKEFVCYDDGALVERHVGVNYALQGSGGWEIVYNDRQVAYYTQPLGETCQVEQVTPL